MELRNPGGFLLFRPWPRSLVLWALLSTATGQDGKGQRSRPPHLRLCSGGLPSGLLEG